MALDLRLGALLMVLAVALASVAPVVNVTSAQEAPSEEGAGEGAAHGLRTLVRVLSEGVERVRALLIRWEIPNESELWVRLEKVNESIANLTALIDEGKIEEAKHLARQLFKELALIVRDAARIKGVMEAAEIMLRAEIRHLNRTINVLLNLTVRLEKVNETVASEIRAELKELQGLLEEALRELDAGNLTKARELLLEVKEALKEVREKIEEVLEEVVKERVEVKLEELAGGLEVVASELEEKADELEAMGLSEAAEALREAATKIREAVVELRNATETGLEGVEEPEELVELIESVTAGMGALRKGFKLKHSMADSLIRVKARLVALGELASRVGDVLEMISEVIPTLPEEVKDEVEDLSGSLSTLRDLIRELVSEVEALDFTRVEELKAEIRELIDGIHKQVESIEEEIEWHGAMPLRGHLKILSRLLDDLKELLDELNEELEEGMEEREEYLKELIDDLIEVTEERVKEVIEELEERGVAGESRAGLEEVLSKLEIVEECVSVGDLESALNLLGDVGNDLKGIADDIEDEVDIKLALSLKKLAGFIERLVEISGE